MTHRFFEFIIKYSKREQLLLVLVTLLSLPFYYLSLDLPKLIVNNAISGDHFPVELKSDFANIGFGHFEQIPYLIILCLLFLALVFINGSFKYFINTYCGVLGERMLRRLRYQLLGRLLRFPMGHFQNLSQGQVVSMVNQETEPLAGFVGESISVPMYQGGIMITILIFMFVQDWILGLTAIALYPFQTWLIPKLQHRVNLLNRERTKRLRSLADVIGESVAGIEDIHSNNSTAYAKAIYSDMLGRIFDIRVQIFRKKFFIKFLNNIIAQITPFFFFLVGGYLVINNELSFGALVAVLAANKDLSPPWKELLGWYQRLADSRMRYELLVEQFNPDDMLDEALLPQATAGATEPVSCGNLSPLLLRNVSWADADGNEEIANVSLTVQPGDRIAIIGNGSSGKDILAQIIARLVKPTKGKVMMGVKNAAELSESTVSRSVGYLGPNPCLFSSSVRQNLLMGLQDSPQLDQSNAHVNASSIASDNWATRAAEARRAGNSDLNPQGHWIDFDTISLNSPDEMPEAIYSTLKTVDLADELFQFALRRRLNQERRPDLEDKFLIARAEIRRRMNDAGTESIIEPFNYEQFNRHSTVAENLLFGTAATERYSTENLWSEPTVTKVLNELDLQPVFDNAAIEIAQLLVELLTDLPSDHEFSERFNFIEAEQLPDLLSIVTQLDSTVRLDQLSNSEQRLVRSLPFKAIPGRHRLGFFDAVFRDKIVKARQLLKERLPESAKNEIDRYEINQYNNASSIEDNLIFGRIAYSRLGAAERVRREILEVLEQLDLLPDLLDIALRTPVGVAGFRMTQAMRQKIALGRSLLKEPSTLVINEGLSALDSESAASILENIIGKYPEMAIVSMSSQLICSDCFNQVVHIDQGKVTRHRNLVEERAQAQGTSDEFTSGKDDPPFRFATGFADKEKIAMIRSVPMFRSLDTAGVKLIANACKTVNFKAGELIFRENDPGDALYVMASGSVAVFVTTDSRHQIGIRHSPEVIGEIALLTNAPRTASVEATTDVATLCLSEDVFVDILQTNGEIGYHILKIVASRFTGRNSDGTSPAQTNNQSKLS